MRLKWVAWRGWEAMWSEVERRSRRGQGDVGGVGWECGTNSCSGLVDGIQGDSMIRRSGGSRWR